MVFFWGAANGGSMSWWEWPGVPGGGDVVVSVVNGGGGT